MLRFRNFAMKFLGLSFPPGYNDIYLFGNPGQSTPTKLGWYAAYSAEKDDKKKKQLSPVARQVNARQPSGVEAHEEGTLMAASKIEVVFLHCDQGMGTLVRIFDSKDRLAHLALCDLGSESGTKKYSDSAINAVTARTQADEGRQTNSADRSPPYFSSGLRSLEPSPHSAQQDSIRSPILRGR